MERRKRHLGRCGAVSAAVSRGASSWLTRTASGARVPGRNGQMLQLLLSHCAVDGRGVPDSLNRFLTIPLVTGGRAPSGCGRDRAGGAAPASLCVSRTAPEPPLGPSLGGRVQTQTQKDCPCLGRFCLYRSATARKAHPFPNWQRRCTCPSQMGHFPAGSEPGPGGCIAIQTASCRNCQSQVMRVGVRSLVKAC